MNYKIAIIAFLLFAKNTSANDSLLLIKKIENNILQFTTDKTGNIYFSTTNNEVYKYNNNGDSLGMFSTVRKGEVTSIDATNPLSVLIYCANQQQVFLLDRMFTLKNSLDLKKINLYVPTATTFSIDGSLWIYDPFNFQVKKYDEELNIQNTSFNLNQSLGKGINVSYMTEQERKLFLIDTLEGVLTFDQFGNYITTYHFFPKKLQFIDNKIIYYQHNKLHIYDTKLIAEKTINLPSTSNIMDARIERNRLYVLTNNGIEIYQTSF